MQIRICPRCTETRKRPTTVVQRVGRPIEKFCTDLDKLPDVPEIDAFKRGHQVETLLDMFENNFGEQYLYIKFENLVEPELVPLNVAVKNVGHLLPRFYKDYLKAWNKWEEQKAKN
ncbi:uncharacterized protein Dwil_GK27897 [Drosophila willistoni]|uniref:Uncharacterized protein n=1 Tax=Drosophila willistoni TaxID=7260 RepID=A0A0Q9WYK4_DROWI|nr:uncharacterized protein Dwil_GK27897 [Drosophila willistoni]